MSTVPASVSVKTTSDATPVVISPKPQTEAIADSPVASAPAQAKFSTVASSDVLPEPQTKGRVANTPPTNKERTADPGTPGKLVASVAESASDELSKAPSVPAAAAKPDATPKESNVAAPLPAPREPIRKAAAAEKQSNLSFPASRPSSATVQVPKQQQVLSRQLAQQRPQEVPVAPAPPAETASVTIPTTTPAATPVVTPVAIVVKPMATPATASKSKEPSSRRVVSSESTSSDSTPSNDALSNSVPPLVTQVAPVASPVTEKTTPEPRTADASPTQRSQVTELPVATGQASKAPLTPKAENLAFAVRMLAPDNASSSAPLAQAKPAVTPAVLQIIEPKPAVNQPKPATPASGPEVQPQSQSSSNSKRDTQAPASAPEKSHAPKAADLSQPAETRPTVTRWSEVSVLQPSPSEVSSARFSAELAEPAHASPALAAQETHLMAPELPKTSTSSEILLHLTGNDQSSAAIRVADRAGSVNVTVHASDPVLRESLRSNLGELSTQLSQQGWKAETLKPAAMAAQPESQQDSHSGGQRSSQQQQSFGGDRQPQRDRRTPGGHWQQELEQQISSGNAHPGGNR